MVIGKRGRFAAIIAIGFALLLNVPVAFAWNSVGHEVIARIAYEQLSATEKKQLQRWIAPLHHYYPAVKDAATLAAWPDWLKTEGITAFNHWHYVAKPYGLHHYPIHERADKAHWWQPPNVIWAIQHSENILADTKTDPLVRSIFLGFLMHCVGDIHQPFHVINGYSRTYPHGDGGGNAFKIRAPNHQWHSLHTAWDKGFDLLILRPNQPATSQVQALAKTLMTQFPPAYFGKKIEVSDPHLWASESYQLAIEFGYNTRGTLTKTYITTNRKRAMERISLAGYRLADRLKPLLH